jgi:hypothetical protein
MLEIPISSDSSHFSQEHILFGQSYLLEFEWIEREKFWNFHLFNGQERPIALGLKLTPGWPIYTDFKSGLRFWLRAKKAGEKPSVLALHRDFMLMAEISDEAV